MAAGEMDAESIEITGSGHEEFDVGILAVGFATDKFEGITAVAAGERERVGDGDGGYTGKDGDAALEFGEKLHDAFGSVTVQAGIDGHGENAA